MKKIYLLLLLPLLLLFSGTSVYALINRTGIDIAPQHDEGIIDNSRNEKVKKDMLYDIYNFGNIQNERPVIVPTDAFPTDVPDFPNIPGATNNYPTPNVQGLINPNSSYPSNLISSVQGCLNNRGIYEQVAKATGVHWAVIAGIHFREGGCNLNQSLVSGRKIGNPEPDVGKNCSSLRTGIGIPEPVPGGCGFSNFIDSAIYGANLLIGKISTIPQNEQQLSKALSYYNGGGNSNCGQVSEYRFCPPVYGGDDDAYVYSKHPDGRHDVMYLVYCADHTKCNPPHVFQGLGALTVAKVVQFLASNSQ